MNPEKDIGLPNNPHAVPDGPRGTGEMREALERLHRWVKRHEDEPNWVPDHVPLICMFDRPAESGDIRAGDLRVIARAALAAAPEPIHVETNWAGISSVDAREVMRRNRKVLEHTIAPPEPTSDN